MWTAIEIQSQGNMPLEGCALNAWLTSNIPPSDKRFVCRLIAWILPAEMGITASRQHRVNEYRSTSLYLINFAFFSN